MFNSFKCNLCCTEQVSPEDPKMDWASITDRATNDLFFVELIKGSEFLTLFLVSLLVFITCLMMSVN